ncbi:MAG: LppX_LprAFG lipoprotein [Chloroflexi bacterium]|nr:LppX_LprAFG lipoprotein [Chloroflexota bacterium]
MKRHIILIAVLAVSALLLSACATEDPLTAEDVLAQSALRMSDIDTVQFALERQGAPVGLDLGAGTVNILGAVGSYQSPNQAVATIRVELSGLISEADVLWQGEDIFLQFPPLIPEFTPVELDATFDIAQLFAQDVGIPFVMTQALSETELVGTEDIEGVPSHHITAQADGESIAALVGGVLNPGDVDLDIWIDTQTFEVVRLLITEADESTWTVDLFSYDDAVEIPTVP